VNTRVVAFLVLSALTASCTESPAPDAEAPDFLVGGDISFLPEIEDHGGTYSDADGEKDLLLLMKDHGFNSIRLKLWHTPERPYNGLEQVKEMAVRIDDAGMHFLLDIHYSDWWADPGKQIKPAAWEGLTFEALVDSVYQYSHDVIASLRSQGTAPEMVQIGNEIRTGMLWPDGRVEGEYDTPEQWDRLVALLEAGRRGILEAAGDQPPAIMIHFDNGAKNEMCRYFFDRLAARGLDFDVVGLSFYPKWHGTLDELRYNLSDLASRYDKDVYVVETAYPWTMDRKDEGGNIFGTEADLHDGYPPTVEGQRAFLRAVHQAVRNVPGNRGRGIYYWSPEWIAVDGVPSAWENAALFDFDGKALPSMEAFTGKDGAQVSGQEEELETRLRAEIHGPTSIRFTLTGPEQPAVASAYRLTDGEGREIPIAEVRADAASGLLLVPGNPVDPMRVHYLEVPYLGLRALVRRDPLFRKLYSEAALGAVVSAGGAETTFRIFSPRADAVRLYVYADKDDDPARALRVVEMEVDEDGVWEATEDGDLRGRWYDFTVHGPADPGNRFYETHPVHVSDPYALVNDDSRGKSMVWRDGPPPPPLEGGRPAMEDVVAYEVHVQDFTDLLPVADVETGTLPAMVRTGLTNAHGEPIGFDYLVDLGVNVVHLMPVQEYLHYPDDEWQAAFEDDPFAREMGIDRENYQWGYRTTHSFAVESRYRSRDTDPGAEREQFKALVRAFHERGIAVIIDVAPNHTGENMDHRHMLLNFNALDLPYYYRTDEDLQLIGPYGNETKSEERPMVQRWIVDQLSHWVDELGVDGFRIDLAGQIDKQTLLKVKRELPADLIIYGEPWIAPSDPDVVANPEWSWYKADAPITFFQDDARNAFKGSPFDVNDRGWAGGNGSSRDAVMRALPNRYDEEPLSTDGISYLDIHDNWALADRYASNDDHNGLEGVDMGAMRVAAGLLLTSAGPVVIHGGTEMLRSKGLAPHEEHEVEAAGGPIQFKGRDDTFNVRAPNRFLWDSLAPGSEAVATRDFWRGLLALRMSDHGSVFRVAEVPDGHYRWITPPEETLLGYVVGERVLVLANSGAEDGMFRFDLPDGEWLQVAGTESVDLEGVPSEYARLPGGAHNLRVPGGSFLVWVWTG